MMAAGISGAGLSHETLSKEPGTPDRYQLVAFIGTFQIKILKGSGASPEHSSQLSVCKGRDSLQRASACCLWALPTAVRWDRKEMPSPLYRRVSQLRAGMEFAHSPHTFQHAWGVLTMGPRPQVRPC